MTGEVTLTSDEYFSKQFEMTAGLFSTVEKMTFKITSDKKVSLFVTDPSFFNEWENELQTAVENEAPFPFISFFITIPLIGKIRKIRNMFS